MENSRGCWWGAKSHCVFCGIKDSDLTYRAMESDAVLANMAELNRKYGINAFRFSDYILPNEYFNTLLPAIVKIGSPYHISTEMKSNITADKFQLLARAGFLEVQPGIESFNSNVLRKMKKGVTGIQNVFTLMLGKRHTVRILYNILFGFPGDVEDDYVDLLKILPRLMHLDPPMTYIEVKITRWAPLHLQPEAFGIGPPEPENVYQMLFSRLNIWKRRDSGWKTFATILKGTSEIPPVCEIFITKFQPLSTCGGVTGTKQGFTDLAAIRPAG